MCSGPQQTASHHHAIIIIIIITSSSRHHHDITVTITCGAEREACRPRGRPFQATPKTDPPTHARHRLAAAAARGRAGSAWRRLLLRNSDGPKTPLAKTDTSTCGCPECVWVKAVRLLRRSHTRKNVSHRTCVALPARQRGETARKRYSVLSFPYVCPEPVVVK
jgi:hypothetical protein